jgi:hypothetical protein
VSSPGIVDIGDGFRLRLTADSAQLLDPHGGSAGPDYVEPGEPDTTSMMASGRGVAGLYSGPHHVASAIVTVDGRDYPATILRLAGHTDWSISCVVLPEGVTVSETTRLTVYDAAGHALATDPPLGVGGPTPAP